MSECVFKTEMAMVGEKEKKEKRREERLGVKKRREIMTQRFQLQQN